MKTTNKVTVSRTRCYGANITVRAVRKKDHRVAKRFPFLDESFLQEHCSFVSQNRLTDKNSISILNQRLFSVYLNDAARIILAQIINKTGLSSAAN